MMNRGDYTCNGIGKPVVAGVIINIAIKMKNKIKGNNTKNHAKFGEPERQIRFKIQVQNMI